jgi:hypothetical protein
VPDSSLVSILEEYEWSRFVVYKTVPKKTNQKIEQIIIIIIQIENDRQFRVVIL